MNVTLLDDKKTVLIKGAATVHQVEDLYTGLKSILNQIDTKVCIDLSGVTSIDVAGAQVLVSLRLSKSSASIKYINCPDPVIRKLSRVGLATLLLGSAE